MSDQKRAAQYIRMSTDRQDISPLLQREAIAAFASEHDLAIVRTYEDRGKSGVWIKNRPALRKLLDDVKGDPGFDTVLVYDVPRWGRFDDDDAAAYYQYHCRLNGVQVIYVAEEFDSAPLMRNTILKNIKRAMASDYSRDLSRKSRAGQSLVISLGFHMGALPLLGFRRLSVSRDGARRELLEYGQLKRNLTDRVQWVLAPREEVDLVRRICINYATTTMDLSNISAIVRAEGWRSAKGRQVTTMGLRKLLNNEALIGNFVWGPDTSSVRLVPCAQTRQDGSVPRIIDDDTWLAIQHRLKVSSAEVHNAVNPRPPNQKTESTQANRFRGQQNLQNLMCAREISEERRSHTRAFGFALALELRAYGISAAYEPSRHLFSIWGVPLQLKLVWPSGMDVWHIPKNRRTHCAKFVLVARMETAYHAVDFLLLPQSIMRMRFPYELGRKVDGLLKRHWYTDPQELMARLFKIAADGALPQIASPHAVTH